MKGIRGIWVVAVALACGCVGGVVEEAEGRCTPGSTVACYTGPAATEGVGSCMAGLATCNASGTGFGACTGQVLPALDLCVTPIDEDCNGIEPSCPPVQPWSRRFGGAWSDNSYGLAVDAAGNSVLTGRLGGPVDFGGGVLMGSMWALKLDTAGDHIWSRSYGDSPASGTGVASDAAGNSLLIGGFAGTIDVGNGPLNGTGGWVGLVAKLDAAANPLFSHALLDPDVPGSTEMEAITGVAVDPAGNVVISGWFHGAVAFGGVTYTSPPSGSGFVAKLDAAGNHVWAKPIGGDLGAACFGVAVDGGGNVLVTGSADGAVDFGLGSTAGDGAFVLKLSAAGTPLWSYRFPDSGMGHSIATDSAGNVVVSGSLAKVPAPWPEMYSTDGFVAKLDAGGELLWSRSFGGSLYPYGTDVAVDPTGALLVTGGFHGTLDFGLGPLASSGAEHAFVAKLDPDGTPVWSKHFGAYETRGTDIAADASGNVLLTGNFSGEIDFGDGPLVSELGDFFVAKLPP